MTMMIEPEIGTNLGVLDTVGEKREGNLVLLRNVLLSAPDDPKDLAGEPVKTARILV